MKGQGTITSHSSGMVRAAVSLGSVDGRRQRLVSYHHTEADAEAWLDDARMQLRRDGRLPSRLPLGDFLRSWLGREAARDASPKTVAGYRQIVGSLPSWLASVEIGRLDVGHVQAWVDSLDGSPRTVAWKRNTLRAALNDAMRRGLVDRNPAALAEPPRQRRPRRVVVTAADARAVLAACAGWRYRAAVAVSLGCGLRQGELLALSWADVRADRVVVSKRRVPVSGRRGAYELVAGTKGDEDERVVPLPAFARRAL